MILEILNVIQLDMKKFNKFILTPFEGESVQQFLNLS